MKIPRQVSDIMVRPVITASPDAAISEVAKKMSRRRAGSVVITAKGRIIGIVTETDLIKLAAGARDMRKVKARDCMSRPVVTCRDDVRILDALLLMRRKGVRHLPVVRSSGKLAGVVSIRDLIAVTQLISLRLV